MQLRWQKLKQTDESCLVIFTDGSYLSDSGAGPTIVYDDTTSNKSFHTNWISNQEMEIMTPSIALKHYIDVIEADTLPANKSISSFQWQPSSTGIFSISHQFIARLNTLAST